jgi:hypothetical protein
MVEGRRAAELADKLLSLEEIDAEAEALQSGYRRGFRIWLAVTVSTMAAALPGGILYALYWGVPYTAGGVVLSLPTRRKLRELEKRRESLLAMDYREERDLLRPQAERS